MGLRQKILTTASQTLSLDFKAAYENVFKVSRRLKFPPKVYCRCRRENDFYSCAARILYKLIPREELSLNIENFINNRQRLGDVISADFSLPLFSIFCVTSLAEGEDKRRKREVKFSEQLKGWIPWSSASHFRSSERFVHVQKLIK